MDNKLKLHMKQTIRSKNIPDKTKKQIKRALKMQSFTHVKEVLFAKSISAKSLDKKSKNAAKRDRKRRRAGLSVTAAQLHKLCDEAETAIAEAQASVVETTVAVEGLAEAVTEK